MWIKITWQQRKCNIKLTQKRWYSQKEIYEKCFRFWRGFLKNFKRFIFMFDSTRFFVEFHQGYNESDKERVTLVYCVQIRRI